MKINPAAPVDLSQFDDDPVVQKTQWVPLNAGGSNFKTHKLTKDSSNRMTFKAGVATLIFCFIFILAGIAIPAFIIFVNLKDGTALMDFANIVPVIIGLLFSTLGIFLMKAFNKPIVFDLTAGYFWKGRKTPQRYSDQNPESAIRLSEIHAFQLIAERVTGDDRNYYSYELNLVLKDGSRYNVIDHGNIDELRKDANSLSKFLNKPVWDIIG